MRSIPLGKSGLNVPAVAVGCMRMDSLDQSAAQRFIGRALELGANFFDHADIYGDGKCEELFSRAVGMNPRVREGMILQSKCGIREDQFAFSKEYILESAENILKRLNTEYLDVLLLHRPDALMEPDEVAEAFATLHNQGKVRHFGVSNHNPYQMQLLQNSLPMALAANQLQLSITNATMIRSGLNVNMENEAAVERDGGVLDYCRLHGITVQPWSPMQYGFFEGPFLGNEEKFPELNRCLKEIAARYGVSATTIAIAWLLRHPAKMQPVIGTMNLTRLEDSLRAADITLTRQEWYAIFLSAGNILP